MTGRNEGGQPLPETQPTNPGQPQQPGSQSGDAWNRDQLGQNLERQAEMNRRRTSTPDGSPLPGDDDGAGTTTKGAGSEGTTRY
jgi:hypothetical protein